MGDIFVHVPLVVCSGLEVVVPEVPDVLKVFVTRVDLLIRIGVPGTVWEASRSIVSFQHFEMCSGLFLAGKGFEVTKVTKTAAVLTDFLGSSGTSRATPGPHVSCLLLMLVLLLPCTEMRPARVQDLASGLEVD